MFKKILNKLSSEFQKYNIHKIQGGASKKKFYRLEDGKKSFIITEYSEGIMTGEIIDRDWLKEVALESSVRSNLIALLTTTAEEKLSFAFGKGSKEGEALQNSLSQATFSGLILEFSVNNLSSLFSP